MEKNRIRPVKAGKGIRMSYSRQKEVLEMPNLIEVQKDSYQWFLDEGLKEVFADISPIEDYSGHLSLEFVDFTLCEDDVKYTIPECKQRDATYAAPLKVKVRLYNKETDEINEHEIFMGDLPLMTETGTFVINGAERVIVSQLVRSPGIYYGIAHDKVGKELYSCTVIPNRGAWLEYETDSNDIFYVRVDRTRKVPITVLLRALGLGTNQEIIDLFGEEPKILASFGKDVATSYEEGLLELYKKIRPGEPLSVDSAESLITAMFFDPRRYDLAKVGRYKFNKKLAFKNRLRGKVLAEDVVLETTGEVIEKGTELTRELAEEIQNAAVPAVYIATEERNEKVLSNMMVDLTTYVDVVPKEVGITELVYYPALKKILDENESLEDIKEAIRKNVSELVPKHITKEDIFASINYLIGLSHGVGNFDDIDHLGNRRMRCVGELLQNQLRIGFSRMDKIIKERMTVQDGTELHPQNLINIRPVVTAIREFFGSSPLSQFMDQNNPLAELTHKRRLSALGPGGLSRDRASFEVRDVHYTHYGRMCPIETPEGPNIGLISYLATYAKISDYGFIEAPYRKVDKATGKVTDIVEYMTADVEDNYIIAQANEPLDAEGRFVKSRIIARDKSEILEVDASQIDYVDVAPKMLVSVATAMIPFLENDDNTRALMGSNMQKQAVPLMISDAPIVGTGMEYKAAIDSGVCVLAKESGVVERVTADDVTVRQDDGTKVTYHLIKFKRSNQGTCINQKPIVSEGDRVEKGDVVADGPATYEGEISLGKNALIGFMTWEGYNYEDAVLLNERLVRDDMYTSIHIEEYSHEARDTKLGEEVITREIPNVGDDALKDLNSDGIVKIGTEVRSGDILVGKVTPKGETELTAEERLLRAIFGEKAREVRDTSLRVPHGESGIVVDVKVFSRDQQDDLPPGVNKVVRVYIAQKRKISVGDKMAGRHGNKGVVSRILPPEDMPFLADGTPLDIVLNPLGVPSRMNIGQVLEVHLGRAAKELGIKVMTPAFDGASEKDILDLLKKAGLCREIRPGENIEGKETVELVQNPETGKNECVSVNKQTDPEKYEKLLSEGKLYVVDGKTTVYDGRTGEAFDNPVTVGYMYYLKLHHLVDDKIHARSTGPYSLVTQQPLGGKAQFGGQRFGEMEVWALEAYGAAYTLQEILTVKSDDVTGRVKTYEAIVQGQNIPTPGVPESFKVLVKELQSLALDVRVLDKNGEEIELAKIGDDDLETPNYVSPIEDEDGISASDLGETVQTDELFDSFTEEENEDGDGDFFADDVDSDSFDV